jgi:hypothetical protein
LQKMISEIFSYTSKARIAGEELKNTINNIIDATKLKINRLDVNKNPTNIFKMLCKVWRMVLLDV